MMFLPFFNEFPELIENEFRTIFVFEGTYKHIPPGNYAFSEMFCPDLDCDCQRVIINVISNDPPRVWTTLNYGWESEKFYKKWWGDVSGYMPMSGVTFDHIANSDDPLEKEFLAIFQDLINNDKNYALRIQKHYNMFKARMKDKKTPMPYKKLESAGRNDPCPCNSGKKFKKCCLVTH